MAMLRSIAPLPAGAPFAALAQVGEGAAVSEAQGPKCQNRFRDGFERWLPRALELSEEELEPLNVDIIGVITAGAHALRTAELYVEELEQLPRMGKRSLQELQELLQALCWAQGAYRTALKPPKVDPALRERAKEIRGVLRARAQIMRIRKQVNPEQLRRIERGNGYRLELEELNALVALLKTAAANGAAPAVAPPEELEEAEQVLWQLFELEGMRRNAPERRAQAADERLRIYTLFVRAYRQLCRGIAFVRWDEGDAKSITPSLHDQRRKLRGKAKVRKPTEEAEATEEPDAAWEGRAATPYEERSGKGTPVPQVAPSRGLLTP